MAHWFEEFEAGFRIATAGRTIGEGDVMQFDGVSTRRRVSPATQGVHPIVGVWTYEHYTKSTAYERFSADGKMDLRIPMPGRSNGRYTVSKSTLTEHLYAEDMERDSNVIEVFVRRLRTKLDPGETLRPIETLRGQGYRWMLPRK